MASRGAKRGATHKRKRRVSNARSTIDNSCEQDRGVVRRRVLDFDRPADGPLPHCISWCRVAQKESSGRLSWRLLLTDSDIRPEYSKISLDGRKGDRFPRANSK